MPILRWHGWGAKCLACGDWIQLNNEVTAWEERDQVKISLDVSIAETQTLEEIIHDACGCGKPLPRRSRSGR